MRWTFKIAFLLALNSANCFPSTDFNRFFEDVENAREIYALYPQVSRNFISLCRDCYRWANLKAKACKSPQKTGEIENFIRHLCWQANLTYWYGQDVAKGIGDIHEGIAIKPKMTKAEELDGCIDQENNIRGRKLGKSVIQGLSGLWMVPYTSVMKYVQDEIQRSFSDYCLGQPPTNCPKSLQSSSSRAKTRESFKTH
jgi:hypothetical protein